MASGLDAAHRPGMTTEGMLALRQSNPTGKSLLIFRNRVKPKNYQESKIFLFSSDPNHFTSIDIPSREEGRIMIVTVVGMGCGGRK